MPPIVIDLSGSAAHGSKGRDSTGRDSTGHGSTGHGSTGHGSKGLGVGLQGAEYSRDIVHQVVQTLAEGKLVLFPTETVYGIAASACSEEGMLRLIAAKGRDGKKPFTLAIKSAEEALDYVPHMGALGERLARRCWPGPITLVLDHTPGEGLVNQLPPRVQNAVIASESQKSRNQSGNSPKATQAVTAQKNSSSSQVAQSSYTLGLRVPAHTIVLDVLQMLTGPIALSSANRSGEPTATTARAALQSLEAEVAMVLDDGKCHYGQPSTVVRVSQRECSCLREGVVGESALDRLTSMIILFVCTGNTCRSPMAEAIMRRQIAGQLGVEEDALEQPDHKTGRPGVIVASAGIAALPGCSPSSEAVEVMQEKGIYLNDHESQPLTDKLVQHADFIYTMTAAHRQALLRVRMALRRRLQLPRKPPSRHLEYQRRPRQRYLHGHAPGNRRPPQPQRRPSE